MILSYLLERVAPNTSWRNRLFDLLQGRSDDELHRMGLIAGWQESPLWRCGIRVYRGETIKPFEAGMPVLDVSEVVRIEQRVAESGTSLLTLMTRAGKAVAEVASEMLTDCDETGKKVVILAGSGNNGGDGWVAASNLAAAGYGVTLVSKTAPEELSAEPARTAAMEAAKSKSFACVSSPSNEELASLLAESDLIIDAILGTGFVHSEVRSPYDEWMNFANEAHSSHGVRVLAVDCPSGLNAQTGQSATSCINADTTITMIAAKTGLLQESAQTCVGKLLVAPIGVDILNSDDYGLCISPLLKQ